MKDRILRLERLDTTEWNGSEDENVDFHAIFESGRRMSFTAFTPLNILRLMNTSYASKRSLFVPGLLVVRRIDEECIREAVEAWASFEERRLAWEQDNSLETED